MHASASYCFYGPFRNVSCRLLKTRSLSSRQRQHASKNILLRNINSKISDTGIAVLGVAAFVAADCVTARILDVLGSKCPASVANLVFMGLACCSKRSGSKLEAALGAGAGWLRCGLPLFLTPVIVAPIIADAPAKDSIPKLIGLTLAGVVFQVALSGHLLGKLLPSNANIHSLLRLDCSLDLALRQAQKWISSPNVALKVGIAGLIIAGIGAIFPDFFGTRAPLCVAATTSVYCLAPTLTPASVAHVLPPTLSAGAAMLLATYAVSSVRGSTWKVECEAYLAGVTGLTTFISPAIATLGLFTHTHRHLLSTQFRPLLGTCAVVAPVGLVFTAALGRLVGLDACEISSVLPATTTTGLAITMDSRLTKAKAEWIPLGTIVAGFAGLCAWPLLLRATALTNASSLVRGFALGSVSHVSVVAALSAAQKLRMAEAAAISFFLVGTTRCLFLQLPGVPESLV